MYIKRKDQSIKPSSNVIEKYIKILLIIEKNNGKINLKKSKFRQIEKVGIMLKTFLVWQN